MEIQEIANRINDMCYDSKRDGAIDVGLWVMNNCHLSDKDYESLSAFLYKEYDFEVED